MPSRTRRATDSNLVLEAPPSNSSFSQVASHVMVKARRDRRATADNVSFNRVSLAGPSAIFGPSSPSDDDEEDLNSERLPVVPKRGSGGLSAVSQASPGGAATAVALSHSFSKRRRAPDSEVLPGLEPIQERMFGGPAGTLDSPSLRSAGSSRTNDEEGDMCMIRSVHMRVHTHRVHTEEEDDMHNCSGSHHAILFRSPRMPVRLGDSFDEGEICARSDSVDEGSSPRISSLAAASAASSWSESRTARSQGRRVTDGDIPLRGGVERSSASIPARSSR